MILNYNYENKFLDEKLSIGLALNNKEINKSNYERIILKNKYFQKVKDHYENIIRIEFEESMDDWGDINKCFCFDDNEIIAIEKTGNVRNINKFTTVCFEPRNFKI